jgi:flagellar hook-length control protein FliK
MIGTTAAGGTAGAATAWPGATGTAADVSLDTAFSTLVDPSAAAPATMPPGPSPISSLSATAAAWLGAMTAPPFAAPPPVSLTPAPAPAPAPEPLSWAAQTALDMLAAPGALPLLTDAKPLPAGMTFADPAPTKDAGTTTIVPPAQPVPTAPVATPTPATTPLAKSTTVVLAQPAPTPITQAATPTDMPVAAVAPAAAPTATVPTQPQLTLPRAPAAAPEPAIPNDEPKADAASTDAGAIADGVTPPPAPAQPATPGVATTERPKTPVATQAAPVRSASTNRAPPIAAPTTPQAAASALEVAAPVPTEPAETTADVATDAPQPTPTDMAPPLLARADTPAVAAPPTQPIAPAPAAPAPKQEDAAPEVAAASVPVAAMQKRFTPMPRRERSPATKDANPTLDGLPLPPTTPAIPVAADPIAVKPTPQNAPPLPAAASGATPAPVTATPDTGAPTDAAPAEANTPKTAAAGTPEPVASPAASPQNAASPAPGFTLQGVGAQTGTAPTQAPAPAPVTAAAPAHQPTVAAHAGTIGHDTGVAIARHIAVDGAQSMTIRLSPAEFGRVEVNLSVDTSGVLRATVAADSSAALNMLRRESTELTNALTDAGVRADAQTLRFDDRSSGGDRRGNQPAWQQANASNRNEPEPELPAAAAAYRPMATRGRVDLMA